LKTAVDHPSTPARTTTKSGYTKELAGSGLECHVGFHGWQLFGALARGLFYHETNMGFGQ
jgi:hypothetical protein